MADLRARLVDALPPAYVHMTEEQIVDVILSLPGIAIVELPELKMSDRTTSNGQPYTAKSWDMPGFWTAVTAGDIESFGMHVDDLMTFYPREVREIAAALLAVANAAEEKKA